MPWFQPKSERRTGSDMYEALPASEKDEESSSEASAPVYHPMPQERRSTLGTISALIFRRQSSSPPSSPQSRRSTILGLVGTASVLTAFLSLGVLAGFLLSTMLSRPPRLPYRNIHTTSVAADFRIARPWNASTPSPCGDSIESARAAGCHWSPMIWAWFPAACYDWELEERFLAERDWAWYSNPADVGKGADDHENDSPGSEKQETSTNKKTSSVGVTTQLSRDAVLRGDHPQAYVSAQYHKMHCAYAFRKLFRSVLGMTLGDNYLLTAGHMHHCDGNMITDGWGTTAGVAKWLDCVVI